MKKTKLMAAFLSMTLAVTSLSVYSSAASGDDSTYKYEMTEEKYKKCDFNSDGKIDGVDAWLLLRRYNELVVKDENYITYPVPDQATRDNIDKYGDVYADGEINGIDATLLLIAVKKFNIPGDINTDGILDAKDASLALRYYSRCSSESESDTLLYNGDDQNASNLGDYDNNNVVDARDASLILKYYAENSVISEK